MSNLTLRCDKICCDKVEKDIEQIAKDFGLDVDIEKKDNSFLIQINGHNYNKKYDGYEPIDSYPYTQSTQGLKSLSKYIYDYQFKN